MFAYGPCGTRNADATALKPRGFDDPRGHVFVVWVV